MSIPPVRESFLENIRGEVDRLTPVTGEIQPVDFGLYEVVATPKPGPPAGALSPDDLVCLDMTCYEFGTTKVTALSDPDNWGQWYPQTTSHNSQPPFGTEKINPWPNVELAVAWKEVLPTGIGGMVKSVTLSQVGGLAERTIPKYHFVFADGERKTVDAFVVYE